MAYYPLHYGAEYLDASIRSIDPCVSRIIILYTEEPSFGHVSGQPCPETEEELKRIAYAASEKVEWVKIKGFGNEGAHRKMIFEFAGGDVDMILAVDADEVWDTEVLKQSILDASKLPNKYIKVDGFINFWKSFNTVCLDHFHPVRFYNLRATNDFEQGCVKGRIYHFSTAQSEKIMRYKYGIHGHASEIRSGWLEQTYFGWNGEDGDLHPVSLDLWNPAFFDKTSLPEILKNHPNYNKQTI